ncbi:MAG: FAD-dependent oxidoreductase [Treponema sp.]|nr:FAD-dependent oxidoreductase [Treponema sp.]
MKTEVTITIKPEQQENQKLISDFIARELKKKDASFYNSFCRSKQKEFVFVKKSIDARHGQVKLHLRYAVYVDEKPASVLEKLPVWKKADGTKTVVIVGSGPAGLFAAFKLLEYGIKPVIIERGTDTAQRRKDIALISTKDFVNPDSNYCFGEGGAGTFSDGKLYTRSNKRGDISSILQIFHAFGADQKILTDAHPHIGTDRLPKIINAMRNKIIELGGEVHFNTLCTDFIIENGRVKGVVCTTTTIFADAVILATGHSATDIYRLIAKAAPAALEAKTFAVGVRVEHPRTVIDSIQYHGKTGEGTAASLGAAEYRVTTQVDGRGVYSFCMCPGGFVVPSASGPNEIVVNGMSAAARNSKWSNAAIVVETRPKDIPQEFTDQAKTIGCPALAGLLFRTDLEQKAKQAGKGQAAPAQLLTDFLENRATPQENLPPTSYTPGIVSSNLNSWLPPHIKQKLAQGIKQINQNMKGFIDPAALMIAVETRTSTPVRIQRNKDTFECTELAGLYPAGEGSGYAGGIVSSAMDGENVAEAIADSFFPKRQ